MNPREVQIDHESAQRYESSRVLAKRYVKDDYLQDTAWQWAVWFVFNSDQCGTRCPYWPEECFVGSETCMECPGCEGIQIVTAHTGRVYCRNKKAEVLPLPECYFLPEGRERLDLPGQLPTELCPW